MNYLIWLIIGGVLGWLASIVMRTNEQQGIFLNVVVGIIGAVLGGLLLAPMIGSGTINDGDYSLASLGVSFVGAVVLLAIVNLLRGRRIR
ncbi:MAG TPA: GlsB/YeaQ/YmgE family stress response membrane protein [Duganella sp.]|nr:GlsB/YeaQ/YmgE family stress response membrane protein [Duganella sp.]